MYMYMSSEVGHWDPREVMCIIAEGVGMRRWWEGLMRCGLLH